MELDDLKKTWEALDAKLKKNEELKESIILEMMKSKTGKLVNRFILWEIISVVVLLITLPVCVFWLDRYGGRDWAGDITVSLSALICLVYPIWGVLKIHGLMKFDLSNDVGNNMFYVNRYNLQLKREKKYFLRFMWPALVILLTLHYVLRKASIPMFVCLISTLLIGTLVSYWSYKKYDKDITSILRSLDEIRELKEEL